MGLNIGLNAVTSGGLIIATIFLVIMGILLVSAADKISEIPEFAQSSKLQDAQNRLQTAYILIFVAAGVTLLLAIAYGGHDIVWSPTEWIHGFFFLVVIALLVIGTIYAYTVLSDLYTPQLEDRNGSDSFIWASLLFAILSFMIIVAMGSGRAGYNAVRGNVTCRVNEAERKVHDVHSKLTGEPVDYGFIGADDPNNPNAGPSCAAPQTNGCGPPSTVMMMAPPGCPAPRPPQAVVAGPAPPSVPATSTNFF